MKVILLNLSVLILTMFSSPSCMQNAGKNTADNKETTYLTEKIIDTTPISISISTTTSNTNFSTVNKHIFGLNIGFAFVKELDKDSGFVQLLRAMHPDNLRFPGGTVGNYYHPDAPAYGFKFLEIYPALYSLYNQQSKRNENILQNYLRLTKDVNANGVFCANVLTGTPEEVLQVIDVLKKNNVNLLGVELGNEFSGEEYRKKFPDAKIYINAIQATANAIKLKYPDLKLAVIGSIPVAKTDQSQRAKFMRAWDNELKQVNFYDAVVVHEYTACPPCTKESKTVEESFTKNMAAIGPEKLNKIELYKQYYQATYTSAKKIWMTEWNIADPNFEGTFLQGLFVYEMFLNLLDMNVRDNMPYEITNAHSIVGFVNDWPSKNTPLEQIGNDRTTIEYYAFKYLSTTLQPECVRLGDNFEKNPQEGIIVKSFYDKSSKRTLVYFLNRSGKPATINLADKNIKNASYTVLETTKLYAAISKTYFEAKHPEMNNIPVTEKRDIKVENNQIKLAPYAFGYVAYIK